MIRTESLTSFAPDAELLLYPYSAEEFSRSRPYLDEVLRLSEASWAIYAGDQLLCYAGIVRGSLLSTPNLWLLLGKGLTLRTARFFRYLTSLVRERYPHVRVVVEAGWETGERFAAFCGFLPSPEFVTVADKSFRYYEVR